MIREVCCAAIYRTINAGYGGIVGRCAQHDELGAIRIEICLVLVTVS